MSTKKPYVAPDTERHMPAVVVEGPAPVEVPPDVLERFRRDSSRPQASPEDFRRELWRAALGPGAKPCPACSGTGLVDGEAIGSATTLLPPPPSTGDLGIEPGLESTFQDEPTRPER